MPDARGHGRSSMPDDDCRYEDHAKDIESLIEALGLVSPIVVGHSMGGMVAALVASRTQKLLRGLILADPTFLSPEMQRQVYESDVIEQHRQILNKSLKEAFNEAQVRYPHRSLEILKLIIKARQQTSMSAFKILTPPNPSYKQLVNAIEIPSLLVFGETGVVSSTLAEELRNLNPKFHIEKIAKVGHGLHYDRPVQFLTVVKAFLHSI